MKSINIKESNLKKILAFLESNSPDDLQGIQIKALYHLQQKKGEIVKCENEKHELHGLKCIPLPDRRYIAITHIPLGKENSFYPCEISIHVLSEID